MALTQRYVRADAAGGGNGTTDTNSGGTGAWTLAEALAAYTSGMCVNVRSGTYANTTTDRTFATNGTVTAPVWFRGFNATPGDCEADPTLAHPQITFTTGRFIGTGAHLIWSCLDVSGARTTNSQASTTGASCRSHRCRFTNTGTNANSLALSVGGTGQLSLSFCYLSADSAAGSVLTTTTGTFVYRSAFEGGGAGINPTGGNLFVVQSALNRCGSHGFNAATTSNLFVVGCTIAGCGGDGVRLAATPNFGMIAHCLIAQNGGWGINNSTGTAITLMHRYGNDFYSNTSGNETGLGDSPSISELAESASPFANLAGGDLALLVTSAARGGGGGPFENQSYSGYGDVGAIQRHEGVPRIGSPLIRRGYI